MAMTNPAATNKSFQQLTTAIAIAALLLVFMGALAPASAAQLGCPAWPWCMPKIFPADQVIQWLEVGHRLMVGVALLLTVIGLELAWLNYRPHRLITWTASAAALTILLSAMLGAVTVWTGHHPLVVAAHLLAAAVYLALAVILAVAARYPADFLNRPGVTGRHQKSYLYWLLATGGAILLLILTGATVSSTGTGLACPDWPLCRGQIFPTQVSGEVVINLVHRFTVVAVGVTVAAIILQTRRRYAQHRQLGRWTVALGLLFMAQVVLGGLNVLLRLPELLNALHLTLAMAIWASLVGLTSVFCLTARSVLPVEIEQPAASTPYTMRQKAAVYFKLTKPWILILLLVTTITAMFIAAQGVPPLSLILYTLLGGALASAGASVLNSYVDSDIDHLMSRTSRRPTVTGLVSPQETLFFGLALSTLSFLVFALFVNTLSAALSTIGILYYVFFYTLYLKRATIHNIIIGGAAGAIPPLVGWTAVTNSLDLGAFYLFAIIFFWTPPHTWALALLVTKDYANARVPMLPVVVGERETTYQIFLYTVLLITLTLLPFAGREMGWLYLLAALALGLPFLYMAWGLWRNFSKRSSKKLYKFSQLYLALLFLMMALDRTFF
jgi:protoheme IX farnesyltransferase